MYAEYGYFKYIYIFLISRSWDEKKYIFDRPVCDAFPKHFPSTFFVLCTPFLIIEMESFSLSQPYIQTLHFYICNNKNPSFPPCPLSWAVPPPLPTSPLCSTCLLWAAWNTFYARHLDIWLGKCCNSWWDEVLFSVKLLKIQKRHAFWWLPQNCAILLSFVLD